MTRAILFCLLVAVLTTARAASGDFSRGNELYAAGKYAEAASAYEAQVRRGEHSANLFYNLANADFRLGKRGTAILNYHRALLLDPGHAEAVANLAFVRGAAEPEAPAADSGPLAWVAAISGWVAVFALVLGAVSRARRFAAWSVAAIALLGFAGAAAAVRFGTHDAANASAAIVLEDKTRTSYAPADSSALVANLAAGDQIKVLADRGAWLYAQLPNGARAWLPSAKAERLIPRAPSS